MTRFRSILCACVLLICSAAFAVRFQAEDPRIHPRTDPTVYSEITDAGTDNIGVNNNFAQDDGDHLSFQDVNDTIRLTFTVPEEGAYRLGLRARSGDRNDYYSYWNSNAYACEVDGTLMALEGTFQASPVDTGDGWTVWDTAWTDCIYLLPGEHDVTITAKTTYCKVDYLDVVQNRVQAEDNTYCTPDYPKPDFNLDKGAHRAMPSPTDALTIRFRVPRTGSYRLHLRNRSGDKNSPTGYWNANFYTFTLDNEAFPFTGDASTLDPSTVGYADIDGWTVWGIMRSSATQYLTAGIDHYLRVTVNGFVYGSAVPRIDYLDIEYVSRGINCAAAVDFNSSVRGQNPYRSKQYRNETLSLCTGTAIRSLPAGGLDADTYDWRNVNSGRENGDPKPTMLQCLRELRDYNATGIQTVNMWGAGSLVGSEWVCALPPDPDGDGPLTPIDVTAQLAADLVRYCNVLVQNYRLNGSQIVNLNGTTATLTGDNLRVYNSITWSPKLPSYGEAAVPKVLYWEIGNEPEWPSATGWISNHKVWPADYAARYAKIRAAMIAVDSTIKTGPCLTEPDIRDSDGYIIGASDWLVALASTPNCTLDFVAYHPYYDGLEQAWGNTASMEKNLRDAKRFLRNKREVADNYASTLFATEFNASYWDHPLDETHERSVADALGNAEHVFTFAQQKMGGANFWACPERYIPQFQMWEQLRDNMGDKLVDCYGDGRNFRMYVTKKGNDIVVWGLNFSDSEEKTMLLQFFSLPAASSYTVTKSELRVPGGDTSLMHYDGAVDWVDGTPITLSDSQLVYYLATFEDAVLTMITIHPN